MVSKKRAKAGSKRGAARGSGVSRRSSGVLDKPLRRRRHSRQSVLLPVTFRRGREEPLQGKCVNLSLGGMFILCEDKLPHGTRVTLQLTLPDGQRLTLAGVVMWVTPEGMGMQNELLGAHDTYVLSEYIASVKFQLQAAEHGATDDD